AGADRAEIKAAVAKPPTIKKEAIRPNIGGDIAQRSCQAPDKHHLACRPYQVTVLAVFPRGILLMHRAQAWPADGFIVDRILSASLRNNGLVAEPNPEWHGGAGAVS